jgi:hypothetical protein
LRIPIVNIFPACCAFAASDYAAAPPIIVMNARRLIEHQALSPPRRIGAWQPVWLSVLPNAQLNQSSPERMGAGPEFF